MLAAVIAAGVTFPRWGAGLVRDELTQRLSARFGAPVTIESLRFDLDQVELRGVEIPVGEGRLSLAAVDVSLDRGAFWSGRVEVTDVAARGGSLVAAEEDLIAVKERLLRGRGAGDGRGHVDRDGRVRVRPRRVQIDGIEVDLRSDRAGSIGVQGRVDAVLDLALRSLDLKAERAQVRGGGRVLSLASVTTRLTAERSEEESRVEFPVSVVIAGGATELTPEISVAGAHGTIEIRDAEMSEVSVALAGGFAGGGRSGGGELWSIRGDLRRDLSAGDVSLAMASFELGRIPEVLEHLPLVASETATIGGEVSLRFAEGKAEVSGSLSVAGLNVQHPLLASDVVRGVGFSLDLSAKVDPAARWVVLERAALKREAVAIEIEGEIKHPEERAERSYRARVRVAPVPCKDVLAALPAGLVPSLQGFELAGKFDLDVEAVVDMANLEGVRLGGKVGIDNCQVKAAPPRVAASRLSGPFTHRPIMRDGSERVVDLQPGSGTFTPLAEISPYMVSAVLTTEDGGFWRHKGFLPSQFEAALRRNVEAGKVRLGASTITMQMVKNVLLSHERTLARKLQELFLTWYVERALPKERIMEIYLNVIEFGPGIYGITRASRHYFGKRPAELTPPEAAYLALMLPTPVRRHVYYCEGALDAKFRAKHRRILAFMHERGRLDEETYAAWKDVEITFDRSELGSKRECLAEIKRLLEATERQRARSGLLDEGPAAAPEDNPPGFDAFFDDVEDAAKDAPGKPASDDFFLDEATP